MKHIEGFKDIHKGKQCFIVGNGYSLNEIDLTKLNNEILIGSNRIYLHDKLVPQYLCFEDLKLMSQVYKEIENWKIGEDTIKIVPKYAMRFFKDIKNVLYINWNNEPKFSEDLSKIGHWGSTVTYLCLQLAYCLGANPIYLIGMDGIREGIPKHFYKKDNVSENKAVYSKSDVALNRAKIFLEKHKIEIYDLTPNPIRKLFKQKKYEDVLNENNILIGNSTRK